MEANHSASYSKTAIAFANALVEGDFNSANAMLSSGLRLAIDPDHLRATYEEMISYGKGPPTEVQLISTLEEWPDRQTNDLGWAYVAISGDSFSEAVAVVVEHAGGLPAIRQLEWGRP